VVKGFGAHDRGQMIMACGTGKTLAALFVAEHLKARRTLVLVPSLSLLAQTMREWTANEKPTSPPPDVGPFGRGPCRPLRAISIGADCPARLALMAALPLESLLSHHPAV
jgi:superfamily II DNA or RNA helicase